MDDIYKKYDTLLRKFEKLNNEDDNEMSHALQDKIYRKFIKDIDSKNITSLANIRKMANEINNRVVKYDKKRWYA